MSPTCIRILACITVRRRYDISISNNKYIQKYIFRRMLCALVSGKVDEVNKMTNARPNWTRRFFILWTGQALSLLGSQLVQFAIIWYLTQTTKSATTLALASMMGLLPQVVLSPFIGTWVDR